MEDRPVSVVPNPGDHHAAYSARRARFALDAERLGRRSRLQSNLRGLAFAVFLFAALYSLFGRGEGMGAGIAVGALVAFLTLVRTHARIMEKEDDALRWVRVNSDALARVEDRWSELAECGERHRAAGHPYSDDLDLFGQGSLFQRLCVAHTRLGQDCLAKMLSEPASTDTILQRQAAIRNLAPELELRQSIEAAALALTDTALVRRLVGEASLPPPGLGGFPPAVSAPETGSPEPVSVAVKSDRQPPAAPDPMPLIRWAEAGPTLLPQRWLVVAVHVLPGITFALLVLPWVISIPGPLWVIPLILQAVLIFRTREDTAQVFRVVSVAGGGFLQYGTMLHLLETRLPTTGLLGELRTRLEQCGRKPSAAMGEFRSAVGWFELRHSGMVHPLVNLFLCWDIHCTLKLERWKQNSGKQAREWFSVLGEVEALSSWAGLAYDEPEFAFPEIANEPSYEAEGLGHPLIPRASRVPNDVVLPGSGTALLVTGSNMSGKSTLLRAMGLSVVMALAGGPVAARRLRTGNLAVRSSIRISDSLASGVSHFYAEIGRLKSVVAATQGDRPVFFLLDEILHGTNSRERQVGARAVIRQLLERGAMGAVSTHDMELAQLPGHLATRMPLVHFREDVRGDEMVFDYKLRQGPVTEGNALRLMRRVGLDVPLS